MKLLNIIFKEKKSIGFVDMSSEEKKKIIKEAVKSANKEQFEVVKNYRNSNRCHIS